MNTINNMNLSKTSGISSEKLTEMYLNLAKASTCAARSLTQGSIALDCAPNSRGHWEYGMNTTLSEVDFLHSHDYPVLCPLACTIQDGYYDGCQCKTNHRPLRDLDLLSELESWFRTPKWYTHIYEQFQSLVAEYDLRIYVDDNLITLMELLLDLCVCHYYQFKALDRLAFPDGTAANL